MVSGLANKRKAIQMDTKTKGAAADKPQKPGKGQTRKHPFALAGFQIKHCACRGGKDSPKVRCAVDYFDFEKRKHRLFAYCQLNAQGEEDARLIVEVLNAYFGGSKLVGRAK